MCVCQLLVGDDVGDSHNLNQHLDVTGGSNEQVNFIRFPPGPKCVRTDPA